MKQNLVNKTATWMSTFAFWVVMGLLIAHIVPDLRWKYDTGRYFRVDEAIVAEPVVHICEDMYVNMRTFSALREQGKMLMQLILLRVEGPEHEEAIVSRDIPIFEGPHYQAVKFTVPCNATPGQYKWIAIINYPVKGYTHTEQFETNEFTAVKK